MDLALNNLQRLIYHKTQTTNQPNIYFIFFFFLLPFISTTLSFFLFKKKKEICGVI